MNERPEIVLVSTSPHRRALMERLGVPFRCRAPLIDEDSLKDPAIDPETLVRMLAYEKAISVAALEPDAILIASDQVVAFKGRTFGKPGTVRSAVAQLMRFSGREHDLLTSVNFVYKGKVKEHLDKTTIRFRSFTRDEAERYVKADSPLDCAGSYKYESKGFMLVDRVFSIDETAIMGLPLIAVAEVLRELGYQLP